MEVTTSATALRPRSLAHVPALDGLRAVAALAVVGLHARIPGFGNGDIGVDIFFTLSGFLITTILLAQAVPGRGVDFRTFYRRRALRLLPAYFSVVAVAVAAECLHNYGGTFKGAATSLVYVANWPVALQGDGLGLLGHMWSLAIEEQFYVVWPALLALVLARTRWAAAPSLRAVLALVGASWLAIVAATLAGAPDHFIVEATPTRAIELLVGCALAVALAAPGARLPVPRVAAWAGGAGIVGLLALIPLTGTSLAVDTLLLWPVISVLTCAVIVATLAGAPTVGAVLGARPMVEIGRRSYGLYLWHFPIFVMVDTYWGLDHWGARLLGVAVTSVVVVLSYRYIEQPFLARKDRVPSRALGQAPAPVAQQVSELPAGAIAEVRA